MSKTLNQFDTILAQCRELFLKKNADYGTSWRILRPSSLTDQIMIKAQRIRSIEEKGAQKVDDPVDTEYVGIVNYCILAMIQLALPAEAPLELPQEKLEALYDQQVSETRSLLANKNHDYDEAWRSMRISSLTDMILMKLMRIKQIEDNAGKTLISEGLTANYQDIINYAVFALIRLTENKNGKI